MTVPLTIDRPVGIDLGTTNSEIALLHPSERELVIYADRFGRKTIPSAVAWDDKAQTFLVGHAARARRGRSPGPIESVKRKMGQTSRLELGPESLLPEEVSSKILGELRTRMAEHLQAQSPAGVQMLVDRAVITVPAYFDAPQIEATRKAGELAGLDVLSVLQEPTAAAIYHTWRSRLADGVFMVYDLGGGTFDVSILRCVGGEYQVLAIDGDNFLGGDDLDRRYADHLRSVLVDRGYALDLDVRGDAEDRARFGRLVHLAQEIKEGLSTSDVLHVSKNDVVIDKQGEPVSFEADVGRADYEAVVGSLVERTIASCERALARAHEVARIGPGDVNHVILVGGSTRVPLVQRRVREAIAQRTKSSDLLMDEVDTCVALGAAVQAAQIGGLRLGELGRARVSITSPLVAQGTKLRLTARVEEAPDGTSEIRVEAGESTLARAALAEVPSPAVRLDVQLGEDAETQASVVLARGEGEALARLPLMFYRGDVRPRATALSRPSVVAKDIALEVVRAGRRERKVLLERGTGLPATCTHRFFTVDQSGSVVLRLLQNRMAIKTLVVTVPKDLPVGSAVELTLTCDEATRMEARAVVGGQELWAQVEPPQAERMDPSGSIDALLGEAEQAGRGLWGSYGAGFRREADTLVAGIREVAGIDPDKLDFLAAQLRALIDEFRGGSNEEMVPPMHRFEETMDSLRRIVYRAASGTLVGMDRNEWDARLTQIEERARAAYEASDGAAWRRTYNEVQALLETAHQEEFAAMRLDDPAYLSRRIANVSSWCNRVERALSDFVPAQAPEVRALQLAEQERLRNWLSTKALAVMVKVEGADAADAHETRRKLDQVGTELERIEAALERLPSIGLVTDRGTSS